MFFGFTKKEDIGDYSKSLFGEYFKICLEVDIWEMVLVSINKFLESFF